MLNVVKKVDKIGTNLTSFIFQRWSLVYLSVVQANATECQIGFKHLHMKSAFTHNHEYKYKKISFSISTSSSHNRERLADPSYKVLFPKPEIL